MFIRLVMSLILFLSVPVVAEDTTVDEESVEAPPPVPCSAEEHRQFDFWIGKWTARSLDGEKTLGTNHIHKVMGECALMENWVGNNDFQGTSINYYDPGDKVWRQTWVDTAGGTLRLEGQLVDNRMELKGKRFLADGTEVLDWITWTPLYDGRVRQNWQTSTDGGKFWLIMFDGFYHKEESE